VPPVFLDLYIDGRHHAPIARPIAPVGNNLIALVGTNRFAYTVAPGESLQAAVAGLAWAINANGRAQITAKAVSDRIEITARQPLGTDGLPHRIAVHVEPGFGRGEYLGGQVGTDRLVVADGVGRAAAAFHFGSARQYEIEYPLDLSGLKPGAHVLTVVVRDGTAVQAQSQADLPILIPER